MLEQFLHHIARCELFDRRHRILLAVSGGIDSTVMVRLFRQAGFAAAIAHCNFRLRGEAAEDDTRFVRKLSEDNDMEFHLTAFDTERVAHERRISIQMAARELRNAWFEELRRDYRYDVVATAHHLNDALETLLLNLSKGTGMDGIAGIPVKHQFFVRPLLFASRQQIEAYANRESLTWRDDSSNDTDDYQRNIIRHHVVPVLKEINPNLEGTFSDSLFRLRATREFARGYLKEFNVRNMYYDGRHVLIRRAEVSNHSFGSVILWELLKDLGFNFDQCRDIAENDHQSGAAFVSSSHQITIAGDELVLSSISEKSAASVEIGRDTRRAEREGMSVNAEVKEGSDFDRNSDRAIAHMDLDKVEFPLVWRAWKDGDRFVPLGMANHKKVSDFLVDEKVSLPDKSHVTVLESGGEIVWVVGMRLSEKVRVRESTKHMLVLRVTRK